MNDNLLAWIWLSNIDGIGKVKQNILLEYFKKPEEIIEANRLDLKEIDGINSNNINNILDKKNFDKAKKILESTVKNRIKIITIYDKNYPELLKTIYDPPIILYILGNLNDSCNNLAVIGSRKYSDYGKFVTQRLVKRLVNEKFIIVSGLARGIDTEAHKTAVEENGITYAVLGCGLDIVYPKENKKLMDSIVEKGCVISEFTPGTPPKSANFPVRNRIISGISRGIIIVEASEKSGSLITADLALEQGRDVFAVPGNLTSINSRGANKLIKDGAKIITDIEDILEEYGESYNLDKMEFIKNTNKELLNKTINDCEKKVVECLSYEKVHIDVILSRTKLSIKELNTILVMLEIKGIIQQSPGNYYYLKSL